MKFFSLFGIVGSIALLGVATQYFPGGFDWNQHFVSTILRGPSGTAQILARSGVLLFSLSLALIFVRLSRLALFAKQRSLLQIGGIGSCVYATFTITVLHDLVVTISMLFYLVAAIALLRGLNSAGEKLLFAIGLASLAIQLFFATSYYTGFMNSLLPWGQRITFGCIAMWLSLLDWKLAPIHPYNSVNESS